MKMLVSLGASFLSALSGVLAMMLIFRLFDTRAIQPLVAIGIAAGAMTANGIRAWKAPPPNVFALLVGALVVLGGGIGEWFSRG